MPAAATTSKVWSNNASREYSRPLVRPVAGKQALVHQTLQMFGHRLPGYPESLACYTGDISGMFSRVV